MVRFEQFEAWYPTKFFKKNHIIKKCNFSIQKNKITGLTGLNGSGKTTLMKSISGLNLQSDGSLYLDGKKQKSCILSEYMNVGFSPEISPIPFNGTLIELLKVYYHLNHVVPSESSINTILDAVQEFDLSMYLNTSFNTLSKGTKKRVLILVSLFGEPEFLILDEPLEGLDTDQRKFVKQKIQELKHDRYVLISSHELLELENICDDNLHIENYKVANIE
jgi:ABC-2 type transport system ATP-binding protein